MDPTDTNSAPCESLLPAAGLRCATDIDEPASVAASSSQVPPPDMEPVVTAAIKSGLTSNIKDALGEIFLVGQIREDVLASVVGRALQNEDYVMWKKS